MQSYHIQPIFSLSNIKTMKKRILILLVAAFTLALIPPLVQGCGTPNTAKSSGDDPKDKN